VTFQHYSYSTATTSSAPNPFKIEPLLFPKSLAAVTLISLVVSLTLGSADNLCFIPFVFSFTFDPSAQVRVHTPFGGIDAGLWHIRI